MLYYPVSHKPLNLFFSGIGGSGMSAIACFMADRGHRVAGSDRSFDQDPGNPMRTLLASKGIVLVPQDGSGIQSSVDLAVFSTAVEAGQPEVTRAASLAIPTRTRPEYLAEIIRQFRTIAVAGTSGKSTVSGMLAFVMEKLGMAPNFIGGGRVKQFRTASNPGNYLTGHSDWLVVEACESDGTIVNYRPLHSIVLNLALDHHSTEETARLFEALRAHTSGKTLINADDPHLKGMNMTGAVTFSLSAPSDYRAADIALKPLESEFLLRGTRFHTALPGKHNVSNALSCVALLSELGVPLREIAAALRDFRGIERRFDILLDEGGRLVIDDYAHNPHKIAALMEAMKGVRQKICYIFQPHGYGPTRMMKDGYIDAFCEHLRASDHLILLPIFYAGGTASRDISSEDLAAAIRAAGKSVETVRHRQDILDRSREWDSYVVFGARDDTLSDLARALAGELMMPGAGEGRGKE